MTDTGKGIKSKFEASCANHLADIRKKKRLCCLTSDCLSLLAILFMWAYIFNLFLFNVLAFSFVCLLSLVFSLVATYYKKKERKLFENFLASQ